MDEEQQILQEKAEDISVKKPYPHQRTKGGGRLPYKKIRNRITPALNKISERIRKKFKSQDMAREKVLALSRETIRFSSYTIRNIHRREFKEAKEYLSKAHENITKMKSFLGSYPEVFFGLAHDAQKEYAEACLTLSLTTDGMLPTPEDLGVSYPAYLNGMGEAVGEMRRYLLDNLRRGELAPCEEILTTMDDIYGVLVTMDFPDALTAGLRRTTDIVRGVLEKTRGDLTLALSQKKLEDELEGLKIWRDKQADNF